MYRQVRAYIAWVHTYLYSTYRYVYNCTYLYWSGEEICCFVQWKSCWKMRICSVEGCQNNSNSENVSFFSFPNTEEDCAKWIKFTKKAAWLPTKNSTICSDHFSPEVITGRRHYLQNGAIPTLKGGDQLSVCQTR